MVGSVIAKDLAKNHEVIVFDISDQNLQLLKRETNISVQQANLKQYDKYAAMLAPFDMVACAVPGFMGFETLRTVIEAGKNVVDISFSPENLLALDSLAKDKKVTAIADCGVAPGISNLALGYADSQMQVTKFRCVVGGLPKDPKPPFFYKAPFSPIDVIEEYTRPARLMRNGHEITLPALSEMETVNFSQTGPLDCFNTDGLRSLLITMKHVPEMAEKTLRYPGHIQLIEQLMQAGFFSETPVDIGSSQVTPLAFTSKLLIDQWKLNPADDEFTIMQIDAAGIKDGKEKTMRWFLYDERDKDGISSMSRTTAYTCTAAINMLADGLFTEKGIFPPELIGANEACYHYIFRYLKQRNVVYKYSEDDN